MLKTRIIPVILWDGLTAVHTRAFGERQSIGSIEQALRVYEKRQCDELVLIDITAREEGRPPNFDAIERFAAELFCPFTVGGGIRSVDDATRLIRGGADKVLLGGGGPRLRQECADKLGCQALVRAYDIPEHHKTQQITIVCEYLEATGAGEVLLTSIPHQGLRGGYNLDAIRAATKNASIPIVAHGGCGGPEDMAKAIDAGAHAVAASSLFAFTDWTPRGCAEWLNEHGYHARVS